MYKVGITGSRLQVLMALCMYLGQAAVGFTISWSGPVILKLNDLEQSPLSDKMTDSQASLVATIIYIGGIPGPYVIGWLSNFKGRKPCLVLSGLFGMAGYILLATTRNLTMLFIGRLLSGFGVGCLSVMSLVYLGEISSTKIRGILLTVLGVFTTLGSIILFSAASFLSYQATSYLGFGLFSIFTISTLTLPESPMFHFLKGDDKAVEKILRELDRLEDLNNLTEAEKEYRSTSKRRDWQDLFTIRSNRKGLFTVMPINMLQHCSGVMAVIFFSSTIFELAGSKLDGNIAMIIIGSFQLIGSVLSSFFVERIGRKNILMMSCVICSLAMLTMGTYFYLLHIKNPVVNGLNWLPLLALILFFVGYDSGLGIIPNVLIGEMFTPNVRSNGSSLAITVTWLSGFLITTAFGAVVNKIGAFVPFWFFSFTCALAFFFTMLFIPETKGKSLLDIQKDLDKK